MRLMIDEGMDRREEEEEEEEEEEGEGEGKPRRSVVDEGKKGLRDGDKDEDEEDEDEPCKTHARAAPPASTTFPSMLFSTRTTRGSIQRSMRRCTSGAMMMSPGRNACGRLAFVGEEERGGMSSHVPGNRR